MYNQQIEQVPVEILVLRQFVRYNRLQRLVNNVFRGSHATHINFFIDLYPILRNILSRSNHTDFSDTTSLTSSVINMCAFYRDFFRSIYGVDTDIYIIASYNVSEMNQKIVPGYNKLMMEKLQMKSQLELVNLNLQLLELLCPYLPNIYFIKTDTESSVMMYHLITTGIAKSMIPNIILSNDLYPLQLIHLPDTVLLKPRKMYGQDMSMMTFPKGHELFNSSYWNIYGLTREGLNENAANISIHPINGVLLEALTRFPERGLPNMISTTKANNLIYEAIQDREIKLSMEGLFTACTGKIAQPPEILSARYHTLDVEYQYQLENCCAGYTNYLQLALRNLWDPDAVQMINDKYFSSNPIDLQAL